MRNVHPEALRLIKDAEGLKLTAYLDSTGVPSIGYGSTRGVTHSDVLNKWTITEAEAERRFQQDIGEAASAIDRAVTVPLSDQEYGALVSFVYNVGPGVKGVKSGFVTLKEGGPSTMLRKLNAGDHMGAASEFDRWIHAGGVPLDGLRKRRAAEKALFLSYYPNKEEPPVLVDQPSPMPTRKMIAAGAGGAVAFVVTVIWNRVFPETLMPEEYALIFGSGITWAATFAAGYFTREKASAVCPEVPPE